MSVLKCKMCGGDLKVEENMSICTCIYCKTKQTIPNIENERKSNLFNRANKLRNECEFDKAYGIYESIISEYNEEAEAYWGLVLCTYGIEYVIDPETNKRIPTCHRSSFVSVIDDENFNLVLKYCDSESKNLYKSEAKEIDRLNKIIIEMSYKEEDYDIFICYKESDSKKQRTIDSLIAEDIYNELKTKYRVFFARVTLEDKLGSLYEPYIFSALNSSKIMLVVGTSSENFNAVWVKNEWSRYLSLIKQGEKKTIIPCYKNTNINDMPKEFLRLQSQDMSKVGALEDLIRGIEKILNNTPTKKSEESLPSKKENIIINKTKTKKKRKEKIIIPIIMVVLLFIGLIIILFSKLSKNESKEEILTEIGRTFYENYYYDDYKENIPKFKDIGLKINLDNLFKSNLINNSDKELFDSCDYEKTKVIIYPNGNFNKKDYTIEVEIYCN